MCSAAATSCVKPSAARLEQITTDAVQVWLLNMHSAPSKKGRGKTSCDTVGRATIRHVKNLLSSCLRQAKLDRRIATNPVEGVELPRAMRAQVLCPDEDERTDWTFLSQPEFDRVAQLLRSESWRDREAGSVFMMAVHTGLRRGELWGLRWRDVHLDDASPRLFVRRSNRGGTKTAASRRWVPLTPGGTSLIASVAPRMQAQRCWLGLRSAQWWTTPRGR